MKATDFWISSGFIGHQLLTSNLKEVKHQLIFLGAEPMLGGGQYRVNFMITQQFTRESELISSPIGGCGGSFNLLVSEGEEIRFEGYWGINREITVEYAPEDFGACIRISL